MRRWNGWGDDATSMDLGAGARAMLAERLGPGCPAPDAPLAGLLARIPPSRLPAHPLIERSPEARLPAAWGESYADWIRKRCGHLPPVPDGVARPTSREEVRELLALAQAGRWVVIPLGGGTSVAGGEPGREYRFLNMKGHASDRGGARRAQCCGRRAHARDG